VNKRRDSRTLKELPLEKKLEPILRIGVADDLAAASETCRNILSAT
jgi:hypothetical protein